MIDTPLCEEILLSQTVDILFSSLGKGYTLECGGLSSICGSSSIHQYDHSCIPQYDDAVIVQGVSRGLLIGSLTPHDAEFL